MTFTQAINQIRDLSRDDITGIVSDYVELKRSGNGMKGCCPFHEEKTPSFHVSDQKGIYKCFGCGLGGDAIDFLMRIEGKEFHEVIYQFADRFHISIEKDSSGKAEQRFRGKEPIPNLKDVRSDIRKAGCVTVICDDTPADIFKNTPTVKVSPPLQKDQANALRKYTDRCELVIRNTNWESSQDCIKAALDAGFTITVPADGISMDWIHYVIEFVQPSHSDIIKLLATIPDALTRSVYITEYSNKKTPESEVKECR
ncbi:CHC2 zinc finger domain-containing protein [Rhodohalobacter mucosus]|uniref:Zinc finger CHC2-type domain-containing protein n=1 Tax=Rhodohalobacter mucosus TaxID=2079485 RepID=A0A316TUY3_9BACT|nr:CHC2 zinc finger domain-containing protein [Rhodohalobacter mucosus]PWN06124.1 hypothetical protein DDZ15_09770 [Rhodohalobacter mucosus]